MTSFMMHKKNRINNAGGGGDGGGDGKGNDDDGCLAYNNKNSEAPLFDILLTSRLNSSNFIYLYAMLVIHYIFHLI